MVEGTPKPPAGWYPSTQHPGHTQWWDGSAWGPLAPPQNHVLPAKSTAVAYVLLIFLGGTGAHRYYVGNIGYGVVYSVLFAIWLIGSTATLASTSGVSGWIFFLVVIWIMQIVDLFMLSGDVRRKNAALGYQV